MIDDYPGILEVLEEFGIRMDPFTYILLKGSVQEAAEYSAIDDLDVFRERLASYVRENAGRPVTSPLALNGGPPPETG